MTTVFIVDDDPGFRRSLRQLLTYAGFEIIAEAGDITTAERLLRTHNPALAVVDVMLPDINGLEGIARLKSLRPTLRVILVSIHHNARLQQSALAHGAEAFIPKEQLDLVTVQAWRLPKAIS